MKYYKYKLINFLKEEKKDQDSPSDRESADQSEKTSTGNKYPKGVFNLRQIANAIATAFKFRSELGAKLDAKKLKASGNITVKAGESVKVSGKVDLDLASGKANITVPIKVKDKEASLTIEKLDVTSPQKIYGRQIIGKFVDPVTNKEVSLGINIDPNEDRYAFAVGEEKENISFGIDLAVDKSNYSVGGNVGFDTKDFISSNLAPKVNVGLNYEKHGGLTTSIIATKDIKFRSGELSVGTNTRAGGGEKYLGVDLSYAPNKKGSKKNVTSAGKIATKGMKKATTKYVDTKKGGLKTVKDEEGKDITKIQKDFDSALDLFKENNILISKKELKILTSLMMKL